MVLEQWFPYDITNMAVDDPDHFDTTIDFAKMEDQVTGDTHPQTGVFTTQVMMIIKYLGIVGDI